jgi:hypothetical protein
MKYAKTEWKYSTIFYPPAHLIESLITLINTDLISHRERRVHREFLVRSS